MFQRISVFSILSVFFTFCFSSFCLHAFSVAYLSFFVVEGMGWGYSGKRFSLVGGETASFSPTLAARSKLSPGKAEEDDVKDD